MKYLFSSGVLCLFLSGCPTAATNSIIGIWATESTAELEHFGTVTQPGLIEIYDDGTFLIASDEDPPLIGTWHVESLGQYRLLLTAAEMINANVDVTLSFVMDISLAGDTFNATALEEVCVQNSCPSEPCVAFTCESTTSVVAGTRMAE